MQAPDRPQREAPRMTRTNVDAQHADVIVVGAGPAGASVAYHLAEAGVDVLVLEKSEFPRDKICGDGLTPRAVRQLIAMGIDTDGPGWMRNKGLRIVGAGHRLELPWPDLATFPAYGLVRTRTDLDEVLARQAIALGLERRENRPMGVAVRAYYETPRHDDPWMESWLELWDGEPGRSNLLPGYGWVFGLGNGTANVGMGILDSSAAFQRVDYKQLLRSWLAHTPPEWGFSDDANRVGRIGSAALPMGFNRKPHYTRGVLLVGDAGGMVNPFNGEGIDYALEAGHLAADTALQALARPEGPARERVLEGYAAALASSYGGYFTLGRHFARLIGNPTVMKQATRLGLPRPTLMRFMLKLMANLTDPRDGDASDRIIDALSRLAPTA